MKKSKKIIGISIITMVILAILVGIIWYAISNHNIKSNTSKINQLYDKLKAKNSYSLTTILDEKNQMYYAKEDKKAYIHTIYNQNESKFIIKDGNSYLIMENSKTYYTYKNNETNLNKIELQLEALKDREYRKGEEKIDNKKYQYEEYAILTSFAMKETSELTQNQEVKTRFYFKGDKLVYIKTIIEDKQELLKVDISDPVEHELFEIPSDYKEM